VDLSVSDRSDIYLSMQDQSELLVRVYVRLGPYFQSLCREQELNAAAAFPPPPGWKEYRDRLRETFRNRPKDETIPR